MSFYDELRTLINRYSRENKSNTPDFILVEYLKDSLNAFDKAVVGRESWYGRPIPPKGMIHEAKPPRKRK